MATKKITDLVELISAASGDVLPIVDISDDITKKIQVSNFPISNAAQTAINAKQDTLVSGTNIKTLNSESLLGSGNIEITASPSGVAGAIQFSDGSAFASDAANLFWDDTNNRLGIGTNAPTVKLEVKTADTGDVDFINFKNGNDVNTARFKANGAFNLGVASDFTLRPGIATQTRYSAAIGSLSAPSARLHVTGSGTTSATTSLLVQNSAGNDALQVRDDRVIICAGMPTSSAGLPSGALYSDGGTIKIV
jgi:hypothetical protein